MFWFYYEFNKGVIFNYVGACRETRNSHDGCHDLIEDGTEAEESDNVTILKVKLSIK